MMAEHPPARGYEFEVNPAAAGTDQDSNAADFDGWITEIEIDWPVTNSHVAMAVFAAGERILPARGKADGIRRVTNQDMRTRVRRWVYQGDDMVVRATNDDAANSYQLRSILTLEAADAQERAEAHSPNQSVHKPGGNGPYLSWLDEEQLKPRVTVKPRIVA